MDSLSVTLAALPTHRLPVRGGVNAGVEAGFLQLDTHKPGVLPDSFYEDRHLRSVHKLNKLIL